MEARTLSNPDLVAHVKRLAADRCQLEADLVEHLAEVDRRRIYLDEGFPSMFAYCTEVLHFSEAASYNRIVVARVSREHPEILEHLRDGRLHLTGLRLLAPQLTAANYRELLGACKHKTRRDIEKLLADRAPKPDACPVLRRIPDKPTVRRDAAAERPTTAQRVAPPSAPAPKPLGLGRFRVQFTLNEASERQLQEVRALLRHQIPDGDLGLIFARALGLLHSQVKKQKFAETSKPRTQKKNDSGARHIPAAIKRAVAERDGGRCTFVSTQGRRCNSRDFLEYHHLDPWARSHRHSSEAITLRCRPHNHHAALHDYGVEKMAPFTS